MLPLGKFPENNFLVEFAGLSQSDGNSSISTRPVRYVLLAVPWQIAALLHRQHAVLGQAAASCTTIHQKFSLEDFENGRTHLGISGIQAKNISEI